MRKKNGWKAEGKGYKPKQKIRVRGATAPSGAPYVWVKACGTTAWIPLDLFRGSGKDASDTLAARGIILLSKEWAELRLKVNRLDDFPPKALIEKAGWSKSKRHYALPDGTVIGAGDKSNLGKAVVLFDPNRWKVSARGSLEEWMTQVAEPLSEQYVATFILMVMFSPPLMQLVGRTMNFGFELAGPKGVGKTTAQCLASSVWGPAVSSSGRNYWFPANATVAGLESLMAEHDDMPMVVEEANLFAAGETRHSRSAKTHQRVFQWAEGAQKARHKSTQQRRSRFIWLTSTNEPLDGILSAGSDALAAAASDRELTIPIGTDRPFGLFDSVPEAYATASDFAVTLTRSLEHQYGHAIRAFLQGLVAEANSGRKALKSRIQALIADFRNSEEVDANSGSARRVLDAFGLIYAGGKLAQEFGALPSSMNCLKATRVAYELNRSTLDHRSPLERIYAFARRDDIVRFKDGNLPQFNRAEVEDAKGFVRVKGNGRTQLILTPNAMNKAFADSGALLRDVEVRQTLISDGKRLGTKKRVSKRGKPVRVYCFRLPVDFS